MALLVARLRSALANRYLLVREIGAGGMAIVYLARDLKHDREVALKVLRPDLAAVVGAERFLQEIRITARLDHPHILTVIDSGESDGFLWFVLPYVRGESLRGKLKREKQLSIDVVLSITKQVGAALAYAHKHRVIHRDLKPENILLFEGEAMLADFGIALAARAASGDRLTETGISLGTPQYMSPEQATGTKHLDARTDIYSLGCVVYEMLAGEPPFTGVTAQAIIARALVDLPPRLRTVRHTLPQAIEQAVEKALAKVPADRFPTADDFVQALTTAHPQVADTPRRSRWLRATALAALGVLVLSGAGAAWRFLIRADTPAQHAGAFLRMEPRRIAVRYFQDASREQDLGYLGDALTEALIDTLRRVNGLTVISKDGVSRYRDPKASRDSIARSLGVTTFIEGTVARVGRQLQTSVWIVDAASGLQSSSHSIQAAPADVLSLRRGLTEAVMNLVSEGLSDSTAAWILVQQAERLHKAATAPRDTSAALRQLERADTLLGRAEVLAPRSVEPLTSRGWIAYRQAQLVRSVPEKLAWIDKGMGHAARALTINPRHARSLELRGTLRYLVWRVDRAMDPPQRAQLLITASQDLEAAVRADPTLASAFAAQSAVYGSMQDLRSSFDRARRAFDLDAHLGNDGAMLYRLFWTAHDTERFPEAMASCTEGARQFPADYRFAACQLWIMLFPDAVPDIAEAWQLAARVDSLAPAKSKVLESHVARMLVGGAIGRASKTAPVSLRSALRDSANRVLIRARVDAGVDPSLDLTAYEAVMRAQMGDQNGAIDLLRNYVARNPNHSFRTMGGTNVHWWWRETVQHPRFREVSR